MKEEHDFDHQQEEDNLNPLHQDESDYPQQDESYSPQEALVTEEITD